MHKLVIAIICAAVIALAIVIMTKPNDITEANDIRTVSSINGKTYNVQDFPDKIHSANMLAIIDDRIELLTTYLRNNINSYPEYKPYIEQFLQNIGNVELVENNPGGKYTSYTVNKGEVIALCLRSKSTNILHDINLIMYVVIHELAHVACPEIDHTDLFKKIFVFLLKISVELGIYRKVNYHINPKKYCGLVINENLLG